MKKRSDMNLSRQNKSSQVYFMPKQQDIPSAKTGYSYLPFDFTRQLFSDGFSMSSDQAFSRHFLPTDGEFLRSTSVSRLFSVIIDQLSRRECLCDSENCCGDEFYAACVAAYLHRHGDIEDRELLTIFFKQMMILLRHCGVVTVSGGSASVVRTGLAVETLYLEIFSAFWSGVSWDRLFPSMTSLASMMQKDRYVLVELIGARNGVFTVEEIACDYSDIMGLPLDDVMLYVSFFDFSFFTWMSLLGIIEYNNDSTHVQASMTDWGRSFFLAVE